MVKRNKHIAKLKGSYLFPEIAKRRKDFASKNPSVKIISLGIGDTTEPLQESTVKGLSESVAILGTREGYTGYGAEQGISELRRKIAEDVYGGLVKSDEIFVSDGAKPDTGRLQLMFGSDVTMAVQDPSYPVYVDSGVIVGQTGNQNEETGKFESIVYMPCNLENNFFPNLEKTERTDLIFFCNPNNPTGAVATKKDLKKLVDFARKNKSIIIYDAAYSRFITDNNLPKSIYEIEGAKEVAIEINSFSKSVGFTGVRLGWTAIPRELKFENGESVRDDWNRIQTTLFNGASNISQHGGLAALNNPKEMESLVNYYLENARIIKSSLEEQGFEIYGGENSPYLWVRTKGQTSWEAFDRFLNEAHVITTPGVGFGPSGEGFVRFSAFANREEVHEAMKRIGSMK